MKTKLKPARISARRAVARMAVHPVVLFQNVLTDLDHKIGPDPKDAGVKCGVVELAQSPAI